MAKGFKGGKKGSPMNMMGQIQQLQEQVQKVQAQLAEETVTESAGGGMVKVTCTGDQRIRTVEINPAILEDGDVELLQDMVLSAANSALDSSREMAADRLGPLASGLPF